MKPIEYRGTPKDFDPSFGQPIPTLVPYLLEGKGHTCVIVCPGGAYSCRCDTYEGQEICEWLNQCGFDAFLCCYRYAPYTLPTPQEDLSEAVRYVREHADGFGIDPQKIGVMGFSAGGHLCSSVLTHSERFTRPDFGILCYGVNSFMADITHDGSAYNLLGHTPSDEERRTWSSECNVTKNTPPIFLFHTREDTCVPFANSVRLKEAMDRQNVRCDLALYDKGNHGVGLAKTIEGTCEWPDRCAAFIASV